MFDKTFELPLARNYVSHWGVPEAARELIQNALDSESPFVYEFKRKDDTHVLSLTSEFTTLSPQTLLLGSSSKGNSEEAIGSFGEGYKIALLVLTRLGKRVHIKNGEKSWEPRFKFSSKFNDELLIIQESTLPHKNRGLTFEVHDLDEAEVDSIVSSCLQMQKDIGNIKSTRYGDILLDRPGMLYVGGLFICTTQLKFGYNIKPAHIKLERDRQTVSSFDLQFLTKNMWFETGEYNSIAEMIEAKYPDLEYAEYSAPEMVKEACYRRFKEKHPGAVAAKSQKELNELVDRGLERVVIVNEGYYAQLTSYRPYLEENPTVTETIEDRMKRWLSQNRDQMRKDAIVAFKELISEARHWRLK